MKWPGSTARRLADALFRAACRVDGWCRSDAPRPSPPARVEVATPAETARFGGDPRVAAHANTVALWGEMAKPGRQYYVALYDDREAGVLKVWLEHIDVEWLEGRVLAFLDEAHLLHYIKLVCRREEKPLSEFKSWTVGYGEMDRVVGRISESYVKSGGKGIRVDLCGVDSDGNVVEGCPLWDGTTT